MTEDTLTDKYLKRLKNNKWLAIILVVSISLGAVASFSESVHKLYTLFALSLNNGETRVVLPKDTGWLFLGYYKDDDFYTTGPHYKIVKSSYPKSSSFPRQGEWIQLTVERNVIISDFATTGLSYIDKPPWKQNVLRDGDYTGLKLPKGAVVDIREVSLGLFPGQPFAVWARVGNIAK